MDSLNLLYLPAYDRLFQDLFTPSTFEETGWCNERRLVTNNNCVIQHHRTPALPEGITHVSLLQPVFGECMQLCRSDTALERTDNELLAAFCEKMATHYGNLDNDTCRRTRCNDTLNIICSSSYVDLQPAIALRLMVQSYLRTNGKLLGSPNTSLI